MPGGISKSHCVDPHTRIDQAAKVIQNLIVNGAEYTEGCGISIDGNVISVNYDPETMDCVDGVLTCTVEGGGGGDTYFASAPITLTGTTFGLDFGDGLENTGGSLVAKAHTYIDVSSSGIAVDFTEVSGYSGGDDQFLHNDNGTFKWTLTSTLGGGGGYGAGTYIDIVSGNINVDLTEVADYAVSVGEYQILAHDGSGVDRWLNGSICNPAP